VVWQGDTAKAVMYRAAMRAQRLAASVVWQAGLSSLAGFQVIVLNALRHQWFGRRLSIG